MRSYHVRSYLTENLPCEQQSGDMSLIGQSGTPVGLNKKAKQE